MFGYQITEHIWLPFLRNPWFVRAWTVQELAFAKKAIVLAGYLQINWDVLSEGIACLWTGGRGSLPITSRPIESLLEAVTLRQQAVESVRSKQRSEPSNRAQQQFLLHRMTYLKSTLPHDKVYGLFTFLRTWGLDIAEPDYERPVGEVFADMTFSFIKQHDNLAPLVVTLPAAQSSGLPSWTPNWLEDVPELKDTREDLRDFSGCFALASLPESITVRTLAKAKLGPTGLSLKVRGVSIGCIQRRWWDRNNMDLACKAWFRWNPHALDLHALQLVLLLKPLHLKEERWTTEEEYGKNWRDSSSSATRLRAEYVWSWAHVMMCRNRREAAAILQSYVPEVTSRDQVDATSVLMYTRNHLDIIRWLKPRLCDGSNSNDIYGKLCKLTDHVQVFVNICMEYAFISFDSSDPNFFYVGRAHYTCQNGDEVYLLAGCDTPMILRKQGEQSYRVVAPAFILGSWEPKLWPQDESELETITLV